MQCALIPNKVFEADTRLKLDSYLYERITFGSINSRYGINSSFFSGITVKCSVTITDFDTKATSLQMLALSADASGTWEFIDDKITFRNVPIK